MVIHALFLASSLRRANPSVPAIARLPAASVDVEIEWSPALAPKPEPAPLTAPPAGAPAARAAAPFRSRSAAVHAREDDLPEIASNEPSEEPGGVSNEAPRARAESPPGLSLDQLGVGAENSFLEGRGERGRDTARDISKRVDRVLADGIAKQDQRRALGPEGPVIASLEQEARRSLTPPNSTALFRLSTDGSGALVGVQVIDANSDQGEWQKLGDRVLARLGKKRLRGAHGANGVTFEIRVVSRVALPSGRDPGLAIDVFNIPVKKGEGKRSSRISVLSLVPKYSVQDVKLPDGRIIQVPVITQEILGIDGDPVDIGAPARRMVHARLERLWAN